MEVLKELQPGFVLVLGCATWGNLPKTFESGPPVSLPDGQMKESRLYANKAGFTFTFGIDHPSCFGWNYEEWSPWVKAALETAIRFQKGETRPMAMDATPAPGTVAL